MTFFQEQLIKTCNMNEATKNQITDTHAEIFEKMTTFFLETNKTLNLTAIKDTDGVILKHIVDSVAIVPYIENVSKVADIGCGGGFPTFPIAILRGDVCVFSVDSVTKKVEYVKKCAEHLGLKNISVSNERAEVLGNDPKYRESFDVVTARAVGRLNLICELCLPLVKVGKYFIAMKAQTTDEEIAEAENAINTLGGKLEKVKRYTLTNGTETLERTLVIIKKETKTPQGYPRNNSQISKKPL